MYYVYELIDPRDNQPFYVGKGSNSRDKSHLKETPDTRNVYKENKIRSIRLAGSEPLIKHVADNIANETLAYELEEILIKKYGRKGYDKNGILTNICENNRPPNHKGKKYEDIYGIEKAKEQKELRSQLQKDCGGYGPAKHKEETKRKIQNSVKIAHANRDCSHKDETKIKIGEANKKYVGSLNKKSNKYILISPNGKQYIMYGSELNTFCKEHNLSYGTFKKSLLEGWPTSRKGKNKNWKIKC
jgi:hypothetical protein